LKAKSDRTWGATGLILCKTKGNWNVLTALQDAEYISGQVFNRQLEHLFGCVTCLPGALTMMKYEAMETVYEEYFFPRREGGSETYKFARTHLGEDR
jgi:cellulose synthase/poly-beta-1,6-N-acetylglucosamine synthase-like glycosyltransferase